MSIAIVCFPGCNVINFEINLGYTKTTDHHHSPQAPTTYPKYTLPTPTKLNYEETNQFVAVLLKTIEYAVKAKMLTLKLEHYSPIVLGLMV